VEPENVRELAAAHAALCAGPLAPRRRAGIFGVSYSGGLAILVALDPAHARSIPYVVTLGAYADLDTAATFLATGRVFGADFFRTVAVDPWGKLVFVRTYENFVRSPADRAVLEAILARREADLAAPIGDLVLRVGSEGRLIVDLFEGGDPERVPGLIARLPETLRARMAALSPARRDFSALRARLYLAHSWDDGIFPVTESERLAAPASPRVPVRLVLLRSVQHVEPEPWQRNRWRFLTRDLPEAVRLVGWWTALLTERDRG
jgi:hypothetical protein